MEEIIKVEHVDAGYGKTVVLQDVNFDVKRSEVFVLLGGSGCGKSTMMKHMIGLNPVLAGKIKIADLEMNRENKSAIRRKIGVMYQSGALFGSMTVLQNVLLPLEEFSKMKKAEQIDKAMYLLEAVSMADAWDKMPADLSGGMKKRAAIARAMALDPEILFLDEPSAGLDPITSYALDNLILKLREEMKTTFVVVTHELSSIFAIADRCAMFDKSRRAMIALGSARELRDNSSDPFVREFFNRGKIV